MPQTVSHDQITVPILDSMQIALPCKSAQRPNHLSLVGSDAKNVLPTNRITGTDMMGLSWIFQNKEEFY